MNPNDNLENSIRKLRHPADLLTVNRIRTNVLHVWDEMNQKPADEIHPPKSKWRHVMKTKLFRYAAAALLMFAALAAFSALWTHSAQPAWAIEQTIEAMRQITVVHGYMIDKEENKFELWVEADPRTGENLKHYMHDEEHGVTWISTPNKSYYYESQSNMVRVTDKPILYSGVRFGRFIEDVCESLDKEKGHYSVDYQYSSEYERDMIVLRAVCERYEFIVTIDPQTKLPLHMEIPRDTNSAASFAKRIDLSYEESLPENIFEFKIPEGAAVIPVRFSDAYQQPSILWTMDQTIKALKVIDSIYCQGGSIRNNDVFKLELWAVANEDRTRSGNCRWQWSDGRFDLSIENQNTTYHYNSYKQQVIIENGLSACISLWGDTVGLFIDKFKGLGVWREEYDIDSQSQKPCVFIYCSHEAAPASWWVQIDLENKLPMRFKQWRNADWNGEPEFYLDQFDFNPELPEGIFDFAIPEGAKVMDEREKDNPENP